MLSDEAIKETLLAVREQHGSVISYTALATKLGISSAAAQRRVRILARWSLVLLLPAFPEPYGARGVRRARVLLCRRHGFEGSWIERIVRLEELLHPKSRVYHFASYYDPSRGRP